MDRLILEVSHGPRMPLQSIKKSKVSKIEVLKREIEILKEVKHPHIIELIEVYEDERYLHLITELCSGGELFDRIIAKTQSSEGHFSEHDAAVLVRDILDAIKYCHEKGIVHRDLKPENFLFLTEADDAPVKIIDFGLSRHDDTDLGVMVTKVGTPYYVAPEVLKREYTNSCDIWSIGVITYILLCGYPPFYGDSDTQIFESVRVGKFDFPSPEWDDISQAAKDFVIEMLRKDPAKRCVVWCDCIPFNIPSSTSLTLSRNPLVIDQRLLVLCSIDGLESNLEMIVVSDEVVFLIKVSGQVLLQIISL